MIAMQISVEIVDSKTWADLLKSFEERTIYHLLLDEWHKCKLINGKIFYFVYESNSLTIGIPIIKHNIFPIAYSGGPLIHWLGFCFSSRISDDMHRIDLLTLIGRDLRNRFSFLRIVNPFYLEDIRPFLWIGFKSHANYEYIFEGLDELKKRSQKYKKSLRWSLRYAEKMGVTVEKTSIDSSLKEWLFSHREEISRGKKRYDILNFPKVYNLLERLKDLNVLRVYVSKLPDGQIASVEIFLIDRKTGEAYRFLAFVSDAGRKAQAGPYTLDRALEQLLDEGFSTIHLMGGNVKELSQFLSQFRPRLRSYYTITARKIPLFSAR